MSPHYLVKCKTNFFHLTEGNVAFHHALLKFSPCHNKTLPKLVRIADWYSIGLHTLFLQYPNSAVTSSSSLSLEQKSTGNITETCCWCRGCYSDPQHCWRRVCLPARQCASTSCSWQSRASAPWDTAVHQSWHVAAANSPDLNPVDYRV